MVAAVPRTNPVVGAQGTINQKWDGWLQSLVAAVNQAPQQVVALALDQQHASISATALPTQGWAAGVYRLSYSLVIQTVGSISSSVTPTVGWTLGGVSFSQSGAALTTNLTTSQQNGSVLFQIDASTDITYSVAYASNAAGSMKYALTVRLEQLP